MLGCCYTVFDPVFHLKLKRWGFTSKRVICTYSDAWKVGEGAVGFVGHSTVCTSVMGQEQAILY